MGQRHIIQVLIQIHNTVTGYIIVHTTKETGTTVAYDATSIKALFAPADVGDYGFTTLRVHQTQNLSMA